MCGSIWYEESLEAVLRKLVGKWKAWEPYLTKKQKKLVEKYNDPKRLESILKKRGYLKMFCIGCMIDLTRRLCHG